MFEKIRYADAEEFIKAYIAGDHEKLNQKELELLAMEALSYAFWQLKHKNKIPSVDNEELFKGIIKDYFNKI